MALELTFVNHYGDTAPKRRRLAKACESCRARKKRCIHFGDPADKAKNDESDGADQVDNSEIPNGTSAKSNGAQSSPSNAGSGVNGSTRRSEAASTANARRFICDLNPVSTFLQRRPPTAESDVRHQNEDIGIWVDKREYDALVRQRNARTATIDAIGQNNQRPHSAVLAPLIDIYFQKIHPVLPILDEIEFRTNHAGGIVPEALAHAVCLVAAKDPSAAKYLRLNESDDTLPPREFCSRLHASVMAALRVPVRFEKITLIRLLALASLHAEGPEGGEEATWCFNQAMHYTQVLGWHLGQHTGVQSTDDLVTKRLFWCLWSLDRMNSVIYGRPIMMSDIDMAISGFEPGESGFPAFEVWLHCCRTLDKVIAFYRPGVPMDVTGWEDDFPTFEDAVDHGKGWDLDPNILATLHLFFLVVAVLSHRSRGVKYVQRSKSSYVRQSLGALEINRLMSSQLMPSLLPLPFLPYAISLALSVSYQHIRQAQFIHQQEDARQDFRQCCQILHRLRRTWSSADVIATISKKVLEQLEKATDLSVFRVSRFAEEGPKSPGICTASFWKPHTLVPDQPLEANGINGSSADHSIPAANQQPTEADWTGLFEGMDDLFGTYLDPNYPVNLDDFSFVDDLSPLDWNSVST
ncbi:Cutinase transcription factor 1 alpha [Pseudocercospora fuligena]|uniref:Cutinase transcription factor 1 alpha n=1 Tax=Pseudocercospora fuligena TaxID=685502 RepID=A0A8H6VPC6_9PEZI|nr:Cutinase transcription factor 1 alpha [Pseudocercospora fuligena]